MSVMRDEDLYVNLNTRYSAAFAEINTRITQRQNALIIYVTLILGISTALLATRRNFDTKWMFFFIPLISLLFACLNLMHDLVEFCRLCERENNKAKPPKKN